jgi:capsular exopolysaccharide synthesis family protein
MVLAGIVGLMLGLGLSFFVEYLDTTLKTKDDVEAILETPVLGFVPPIKAQAGSTNGRALPELAAISNPHSALAEAFRSIRTALIFSRAGRDLRNILITSPMPSEGKTLVSANISFALAQAGKRVLLVDADMRKPRLSRILELPSEPGLSNLLAGEGVTDLEEALLATSIRHMTFLPSGPHPPNSSELLGSERMRGLVGRLSGMFDYIIYDSPPTFNTADAATLCQLMEGVVLVVRSFTTERDIALRARDMLLDAQGNILGAILNNVDIPRGGYYGYGRAFKYHADSTHDAVDALSGGKGGTGQRKGRRGGSAGGSGAKEGAGAKDGAGAEKRRARSAT